MMEWRAPSVEPPSMCTVRKYSRSAWRIGRGSFRSAMKVLSSSSCSLNTFCARLRFEIACTTEVMPYVNTIVPTVITTTQ